MRYKMSAQALHDALEREGVSEFNMRRLFRADGGLNISYVFFEHWASSAALSLGPVIGKKYARELEALASEWRVIMLHRDEALLASPYPARDEFETPWLYEFMRFKPALDAAVRSGMLADARRHFESAYALRAEDSEWQLSGFVVWARDYPYIPEMLAFMWMHVLMLAVYEGRGEAETVTRPTAFYYEPERVSYRMLEIALYDWRHGPEVETPKVWGMGAEETMKLWGEMQ